jgi:hypothetical protein
MGTAYVARELASKSVIPMPGTPASGEDKSSPLLTQAMGLEVVIFRFLSCI